jgi:hypothetical protein
MMVDLFIGVFLACPGTVGGQRGYLLYAMTPTFQRSGCLTLDWLVYKELARNGVEVSSDNDGYQDFSLSDDAQTWPNRQFSRARRDKLVQT